MTVDDKVVEHVKSGDDAKLVVKDIKGKGTGYETNAGAAAAYAAYNTTSTTSVAASISKAIVIKTGYVTVANPTTAATVTGATNCVTAATLTVTGMSGSAGSYYAAVGSELEATVEITTAAGTVTKDAVISITATGATSVNPASKTVAETDVAANHEETFTVKVGETNVSALSATIVDGT